MGNLAMLDVSAEVLPEVSWIFPKFGVTIRGSRNSERDDSTVRLLIEGDLVPPDASLVWAIVSTGDVLRLTFEKRD